MPHTKTPLYWPKYTIIYHSVVCLLLPQHRRLPCCTAVNVNTWLDFTVCNEARGGEEDGEIKEGKGWERQRGRRVRRLTDDIVTQPSKEKAPPGQNAPQGKIYHRHMERETVKSKQAPSPLTVLQGAPVSSILHAGACLKPLLLVSAWAAWLCCPGP